ncbi:MAG: ribulose bisphosphate carboxylase small subunit [Acidibrevibacterium sp.]|uniref:ribulose bisphosphate carboxylase small subunit n=1 Tax=Acidibrevibacterium sp. TaxID=2606776 RepID=UPI003CFD515D
MMPITQGTFSFLPALTDEQISAQVKYCLAKGWALNIEFTDDPHPRNTYWEMWGTPMFDLKDPAGFLYELAECRKVHAGRGYIRVSAFDATPGWESLRLSFISDRPAEEPGFMVAREERAGRMIGYTMRAYATDRPAGARY